MQFWSDADSPCLVSAVFVGTSHKANPSKCVEAVSIGYNWVKPDSCEALFHRAMCHRKLRNDTEAAKDLLYYLKNWETTYKNPLQVPYTSSSSWGRTGTAEEPSTALLELLRTFPPIKGLPGDMREACDLLAGSVGVFPLRAISYLMARVSRTMPSCADLSSVHRALTFPSSNERWRRCDPLLGTSEGKGIDRIGKEWVGSSYLATASRLLSGCG